ncbi:MAG: (E)-4-hydroxy-3-methylbut-2-enyl-diphosphate synthase [Luteolibacter sp.]
MIDSALLRYCPDLLRYSRRATREVRVGHLGLGGGNPIRVQSMITTDTRDTAACVREVLELADAGCEIVRITAQTKVYAANLENIAREVRAAGCEVPLVADIHFKPDAALEAARWVEKIRVNPGNYADKKKFEIREYTDAQYQEELQRIREEFTPLVKLCKELGRAMRIGTNHGSLSDRIMNRYGDTPLGMVESALEFARIARDHGYHNFVFSMKASNPKVMIEAYRLLVARLDAEGSDWNYPIHLGVTEAGDGEDGRIKSAIGIGSLLADGIGDTVRVSLTEDSVHEIPVAQAMVEPYNVTSGCGVSPQAVAAASCGRSIKDDIGSIRIDWEMVEKSDAGFLPHWKLNGGTYAVTFRLADSLPDEVFDKLRCKRQILLEKLAGFARSAGSRSVVGRMLEIRAELAAMQEAELDPELDRGHGSCVLRDSDNAQIVSDALRHFDGQCYDLLAWCVMPNHVHVVVRTYTGVDLEKVLHSWKSFTAHEINKLSGHSSQVWQKESYDHLVRDGDDLRNQVLYVLNNPRKLSADWPWVGCVYDDIAAGRRDHGLRRDAAATVTFTPSYNPFSYERRRSSAVTIMGHELGGENTVRVFTTQDRWNALAHKIASMGDFKPEIIIEKAGVVEIDPRDEDAVAAVNARVEPCLVTVADHVGMAVIPAFRLLAGRVAARHPVLLKDTLDPPRENRDFLPTLLSAAQNLGSLLCDGIGDAVLVRGETAPGQSLRLAYNILQAAGARIFKTDYVACPSCGRTLFNLQSTTQKIRAATGHLKGVRIAVMGCIVNGPGEMADADFGYVGGAPGKINLYVGKTAVKFNIPENEAVERLIDLIREHGRWIDTPEPATAET